MYETKPWLKYYGNIPESLTYPEWSLYGALAAAASAHAKLTALIFMGRKITFAELDRRIALMSRALAASGIKRGDRVLIGLPNSPQAVIAFYAVSRIGAVAVMVHPLSAAAEIAAYAKKTSCTTAVTLDALFPRYTEAMERGILKRTIVCDLSEFMSPVLALGYRLTMGRKIAPVPARPEILRWNELELLAATAPELETPDPLRKDEAAVILFSGGSTSEPKAILLSSLNCNALAYQTNAAGGPIGPGDIMLSILPMFHGFGLAIGIHTILINGGTCALVPRFKPDGLAKLIRKYRPSYMAGVPTLFDSLASSEVFRRTNLSCLRGVFCGGDSLSREIKERFEEVLRKNGCSAVLREGYGLTESVTANMLMPADTYRERSIGIPYPDMLAKVVRFGGCEELPPGEDGEICVSGPTVMIGYLDEPEATAETLRLHPDGRVWLHTGDLGCMDEDGFFFFKQRLKRIIKTSGISVYPSQIEDTLNSHPAVRMSCVIGVPHPSKVQVPKAYVSLNEGYAPSPELERELIEYCSKNLISYSCPTCVEFMDQLPLTLIGKVSFRALEEQERQLAQGNV